MISEDIFQGLWNKYPRRLGRKQALRHFKASVKTMQEVLDIQKALWNFVQHHKKERTPEQFIPHGATWFNNWRDWLDYGFPKPREEVATYTPSRALEAELNEAERLEAIQVFQSLKGSLKGKTL